ncbi:MAG: hypothetical protein ACOCWJ_05140 [Verrucomicrobiota bacterium]
MLRIAIVHHHLRGGGITRVVANAAEALRDRAVRLAVLVGEPPAESMPANLAVKVVPGLEYANSANSAETVDSVELLRRLKDAAGRALGGAPDVWHVHNHGLGKNPALTHAVHLLAREQAPLLLQAHDFAEDGRPENYRFLRDGLRQLAPDEEINCLYPSGGRVHYALLNQRDARALSAAGLTEKRCHVLANTVFFEDTQPRATPRQTDFIVYPTRAIRRKNLGEFLLWTLAEPNCRFAVTLAPKNPDARQIYEQWVRFAHDANLPATFNFAEQTKLAFPQVLASAAFAATTSVGEGFGLAFLEPWLTETPVIGRDLPEITRDFKDHDIDLGMLYSRLDVPLEWVGEDTLKDALAREMQKSWRSYNRDLESTAVDQAMAAAVRDGGLVDFGRLNEPMQMSALHKLQTDRQWQRKLRETIFAPAEAVRCRAVADNRERVRNHYSLRAYGEKLEALYQTTANSAAEPHHCLDAAKVLDTFLDPANFMLLRT